ncbi:3-isopropylmalate dehydratase small subunit [Geomonas sp. RF6]|uniref:3-isopropylmalate dehydratase small subunit n=1 Tax=Geomonas sp. RF6 TaxID=2897342 RepID=UPI001E4CD186|nr:3-isopropylmalate dehydratase small subunit [Geomonas sp. RF6]UFS69011.1 3-isopropylmalate dehydratase small subunit [Geomonas sp. RF6]
MKTFGGPVLFLDRSDINTDEIIPAKYLTEITKADLRPYLLEDLKLEGFDPKSEKTRNAGVVVTRANFGCGSSREHAPWVLEVNGISVVIAQSFARIFRQNMFNCGMVAIELPEQQIEELFAFAECPDATITVNVAGETLSIVGGGKKAEIKFALSPFDKALVLAGGWVDYADSKY